MKMSRWYILLAGLLAAASFLFYEIQILIFHDPRNTFFYMLQDLAFVPVQVLLVTLILNDLMARREKKALLNKMNMVIGAFFSEAGTEMISHLSRFDRKAGDLKPVLQIGASWGDAEFNEAMRKISSFKYEIDAGAHDLELLREFLSLKRAFILSLLENQNLLEHERFTDLLWAVSHLTEELKARNDVSRLPESDLRHLSGDIQRAYALLLSEWIEYLRHLKKAYPYIYSLAVRSNPLDGRGSVIVAEGGK